MFGKRFHSQGQCTGFTLKMSSLKVQKYLISGRVQGVGFRWFVKEMADQMGIKGTVKNLKDRRVEVIAQADIESLYRFKQVLKKGPALSRVDEIIETDQDANQNFSEFKVVY